LRETLKLLIHHRLITDPALQDRFVEEDRQLKPVAIQHLLASHANPDHSSDHARRDWLDPAVAADYVPGVSFRLQQASYHINVPYGDGSCLMLEADELLIVLGKGIGKFFPPALLRRILGEREKERAAGPGDLVVVEQPLDFPRIETPRSWVTIGLDQDLNKAWEQAKAQTIKLLAEQRKLTPDQAARLMLQISDCRVSQVVDIKKGVHCLSPKNPATREDMERPTKETATYLVSHAKDADLNKAMDAASMGMIKLLESERKIARLDAYGLASVAMDCRVGAVADTEKNVHCLLPKSIFVTRR